MSESYIHQLIPSSPTFRPTPEGVARFVQGLIDHGNLPKEVTIRLGLVERSPGLVRDIVNPFTGEAMTIRGPSRRPVAFHTLNDAHSISTLAADASEYNVVVSASGVPTRPPLAIGANEGGEWKAWMDPYSLEVVCRIRSMPVYVSKDFGSDEFGDFSMTDTGPRIDDDVEKVPIDGVASHPDAGTWTVPNSGAATFWIDFEAGKWLYPKLRDGKIDVLDESVMNNVHTAFDCKFVQSCYLL